MAHMKHDPTSAQKGKVSYNSGIVTGIVALAISAATSDVAKKAMDALKNLKGAELHSSVILSPVDTATFKKLGVNLTCEPVYQTKKLFHG